ncbi:hypothetical protein B0T16DRAFT_463338 [Cercophora newfieldiana]|uniref:Uncharacterized protein n=1 Tax=Cercophora newfieldiana TaxID=92897 RepID=A0AA39XT04_9PEZI|nr:hypothetical protein B0T16DRAFT_463338 [Cercophora newfieldiana]
MMCGTNPDGFVTRVLASSSRGAYLFLPGIDETAYDSGLVSTRPPVLDVGTNRLPHVSPLNGNEISAWSRHQASEVYERAATNLVLGGVNQSNMGPISLSHKPATKHSISNGATQELLGTIACTRPRARSAPERASTLYPRLPEEPVFSPSTKLFGEDGRSYYMELYRNQENVKRAELRRQFKEFAFTCLCEAMSVFLRWEEENGKVAAKGAKPTDPNAGLFGDYGSLTKLWESAAKWSASAQRSGIQREEFHAEEFRLWWVRAAMGRGHAEWLLEERWEKGGISMDQWKPMEAGRRLSPPPLSCYDNGCGVFPVGGMGKETGETSGVRTTADDLYLSQCDAVQLQMRELDSTLNHVPNYCLAPGAPDFVYRRKAVSGWVGIHIGLSSLDLSSVLRETGHYDRFLRQGLLDTLTMPVSEHERDLALKNLESQLHQLEADIAQLAGEREGLTRVEAEEVGFEETVCRVISDFLRGLHAPPAESLFKGRGRHKHILFLQKVQFILRQQLEPWLRVDIFQGVTDSPVAILYDQDTRNVTAPSRRTTVAARLMVTVEVWLAWQHTHDLFTKLYEVADSIVKNRPLLHDEQELAFCFRDYLATGDSNKLPMIRYGINSYRQKSPADFYQTFMSNLAIPQSWLHDSPFGRPPPPPPPQQKQ